MFVVLLTADLLPRTPARDPEAIFAVLDHAPTKLPIGRTLVPVGGGKFRGREHDASAHAGVLAATAKEPGMAAVANRSPALLATAFTGGRAALAVSPAWRRIPRVTAYRHSGQCRFQGRKHHEHQSTLCFHVAKLQV